ncbi:MAG: helix-turn-helix domain-containing protein [Alphaproteobacteria bacterium]|nr:helix-turn-helix domain-containing protein [Alphaproteobacteria bacterium]
MKINEVSNIFNALSQENRLRVFRILVEHSKDGITPTEIATLMGNMPRNTLSFHLNALSHAGLCNTSKNGKQIIYKPNCSVIKKVAEFLLKDCCDGGCKC